MVQEREDCEKKAFVKLLLGQSLRIGRTLMLWVKSETMKTQT